MTFTPKNWENGAQGNTPIMAEDLQRYEETLADHDERIINLESRFGGILGQWRWSASNTATPGKGMCSTDADPADATVLYLNDYDDTGRYFGAILRLLNPASRVIAQNVVDTEAWIKYNVSDEPSNTNQITAIPVNAVAFGTGTVAKGNTVSIGCMG